MDMDVPVSIDRSTNEATITVPENIDDAFDVYTKVPIFQKFVDQELTVRQEDVLEIEPRATQYAVKGFLLEILGDEYTIDTSEYFTD